MALQRELEDSQLLVREYERRATELERQKTELEAEKHRVSSELERHKTFTAKTLTASASSRGHTGVRKVMLDGSFRFRVPLTSSASAYRNLLAAPPPSPHSPLPHSVRPQGSPKNKTPGRSGWRRSGPPRWSGLP